MKFLRIFLLLSIICHNPVSAQFPVQANLQIIPPYSPYLSDYAGGNGDRLILTLLLNESPTTLLPVRLRFRISGTPLFGRNASFLLPNPIELQGGIPTRFSGADLTSYFNHWNMGLQTDRLPDGLYNFEFEVLDTQRGIAISNTARASLWIVLGKAPQLNFPVQNSIVQALDPQNVSFSWVARSLSPNSTFQTSYRFTLVEIVPSDREANEAILTTKPLYEEELPGTGLLYGISHPPLEKGRRYAWRVRAVDGSGRDYFENSGFSEVYSFIYGTDCGIPVNIEATPISPTEVRWKGTGGSGNSAAVLRYRKAGGDKEWKSQNQLLASSGAIDMRATGLDADTEYEYELGALCSNCRVKQSEKISGRVRTTKADSAAGDFECGRVPTLDMAEITDPTPWPGEFKKGDTVRAADSELILTSVRNTGPGRITGRAVVFIPAFKNAGFTAEFDNVLINKYKRLVKMEGNAMYIRSVGVGEESAQQMAAKIGKWIDRLDTNFTDTYFGLMELGKIESKARGFLEKANLDDSLKRNLGELLDFLEDATEELRQAVQDKDPERIKEAKKRVNLALRLLRKFVRKPDEEIDVNMLVKNFTIDECIYHIVVKGENLTVIAKRYNTTIGKLKEWNNLKDDEIKIGQKLCVGKKSSTNTGECAKYHIVVKGENLTVIAKRYNTTIGKLKEWNNLKDDEIKIGQKLCVEKKNGANSGGCTEYYTVVKDDNPTSVALKHEITMGELLEWNSLPKEPTLQIGQKLCVGKGLPKIKENYRLDAGDMKSLFPNSPHTGRITELVNQYAASYGIRSQTAMAHFIAQAGVETGGMVKFEESLMHTDKAYLARLYDTKFPTVESAAPYLNNPEKLGNYVYANQYENGDVGSGDGFAFRGRGLMHITFRFNYRTFTSHYNSTYRKGLAQEDFVTGRDKIATNLELAVLSAMWFFQTRVLLNVRLENPDITPDEVSKYINGGDNGETERRDLFNKVTEQFNK